MSTDVRITRPQLNALIGLMEEGDVAGGVYVRQIENVANGVCIAASFDPPNPDDPTRSVGGSTVRHHEFISPNGNRFTPLS